MLLVAAPHLVDLQKFAEPRLHFPFGIAVRPFSLVVYHLSRSARSCSGFLSRPETSSHTLSSKFSAWWYVRCRSGEQASLPSRLIRVHWCCSASSTLLP